MKKLLALVLSVVMCFSLATFVMAEETAEGPEIMVGGWSLNTDIASDPLPDETVEIFEKAMEGFAGVGYEPVAVLGAQVVAGMNIAYLCKATTVTADPTSYLAIVIVYNDLEGNATVTQIKKLDFMKLIEEEAAEKTFKLSVVNTLTEAAQTIEVTTEVSTLGDFMRSWDACEWEDSQYGIYVTAIDGVANDDEAAAYWSYYVNGEYAMVGADECVLEDGMEITWAYETFSWEE